MTKDWRLPTPLSLVRANLEDSDPSTRHLMLITVGESALRVLRETNVIQEDKVSILVASQFSRDKTNELYLVSQINRVKRAMQIGQVVILVNHTALFPALYDVLNLRYLTRRNAETGTVTRMLRLAVGNRSQWVPVAQGFKLIVVVNEDEVASLDLPLLQRFEKQHLTATLEDPLAQEVSAALEEWIAAIADSTRIKSPFFGLHAGSLPSLMMTLMSKEVRTKEQLLDAGKAALSRLAHPLAKLKSEQLWRPQVNHMWRQKKATRFMVLTASSSRDLDQASANALVESLGYPALSSFEESVVTLAGLTSEHDLSTKLQSHLEKSVLIIQCDPAAAFGGVALIDQARHVVAREIPSSSPLGIVLLIHVPPSSKRSSRNFAVDFESNWEISYTDDLRYSGDAQWLALAQMSPLAWARQSSSSHETNLLRVMANNLMSIIHLLSYSNVQLKRSMSEWRILMQDSEFRGFLVKLCEAVLEKQPAEMHVDLISSSTSYHRGTLTESLTIALETICERACAAALCSLDVDANLALLRGNHEIWMCLAKSASVFQVSTVVSRPLFILQGTEDVSYNVRNTGPTNAPSKSSLPFAYRLREILGSLNHDDITQQKVKGLLEVSLGKETTALLESSWGQAYIRDACASAERRAAEIDLETQARVTILIVRAVINHSGDSLALSEAHWGLIRAERTFSVFSLLTVLSKIRQAFPEDADIPTQLYRSLGSSSRSAEEIALHSIDFLSRYLLERVYVDNVENSSFHPAWFYLIDDLTSHVDSVLGTVAPPDSWLGVLGVSVFVRTLDHWRRENSNVPVAALRTQNIMDLLKLDSLRDASSADFWVDYAWNVLSKRWASNPDHPSLVAALSMIVVPETVLPSLARKLVLERALRFNPGFTLNMLKSKPEVHNFLLGVYEDVQEEDARIPATWPSCMPEAPSIEQHVQVRISIRRLVRGSITKLPVTYDLSSYAGFALAEMLSTWGIARTESNLLDPRMRESCRQLFGADMPTGRPPGWEESNRDTFPDIFHAIVGARFYEPAKLIVQECASSSFSEEDAERAFLKAKSLVEEGAEACEAKRGAAPHEDETNVRSLHENAVWGIRATERILDCDPATSVVVALALAALQTPRSAQTTRFRGALKALVKGVTQLPGGNRVPRPATYLVEFATLDPTAVFTGRFEAFSTHQQLAAHAAVTCVASASVLASSRYESSPSYVHRGTQSDSERPWTLELLRASPALSKAFLPLVPEGELASFSRLLQVGWWSCRNGHRYAVGECTMPMQVGQCPVCNVPIGGEDHVAVEGAKRLHTEEPIRGWFPIDPSVSRDVREIGEGGSWAILNFILHGCLLVAATRSGAVVLQELHEGKRAASGQNMQAGLERIAENIAASFQWLRELASGQRDHSARRETSDPIDESALDNDALSLLVGSIAALLYATPSGLSFKTGQLCVGIAPREVVERTIVEHWGRLGLSNPSVRRKCIEQLATTGVSQRILARIFNNSARDARRKYEDALRPTPPTETKLRPFVYRARVGVPELQALIEAAPSDAYRALRALLKEETRLLQVGGIADIIVWLGLILKAVRGRTVPLTREQASGTTHRDALAEWFADDARPAATACFERFAKAFNAAFPLVENLYECQPNPFITPQGRVDLSGNRGRNGPPLEMGLDTPVSFSLPSNIAGDADAVGLCVLQLLRTLQNANNAVLASLMTQRTDNGMNQNNGPRMRVKESGVPLTTIDTPHQVILSRIVRFSAGRDLLPLLAAFSEEVAGAETGTPRCVDLHLLSRTLTRNLLTGKQELALAVPSFSYAGEARRVSAAVIRVAVPQFPLNASLERALLLELDTVARVRPLLELCDAMATTVPTLVGVDPQSSMESFCLGVLGCEPSRWEAIAPAVLRRDGLLGHLCALLDLLEEQLTGSPLDSVHPKFRAALSQELESKAKQLNKAQPALIRLILPVLRELLVTRLIEATWPTDGALGEFLCYCTDLELETHADFQEHFPGEARLEHAYALWNVWSKDERPA